MNQFDEKKRGEVIATLLIAEYSEQLINDLMVWLNVKINYNKHMPGYPGKIIFNFLNDCVNKGVSSNIVLATAKNYAYIEFVKARMHPLYIETLPDYFYELCILLQKAGIKPNTLLSYISQAVNKNNTTHQCRWDDFILDNLIINAGNENNNQNYQQDLINFVQYNMHLYANKKRDNLGNYLFKLFEKHNVSPKEVFHILNDYKPVGYEMVLWHNGQILTNEMKPKKVYVMLDEDYTLLIKATNIAGDTVVDKNLSSSYSRWCERLIDALKNKKTEYLDGLVEFVGDLNCYKSIYNIFNFHDLIRDINFDKINIEDFYEFVMSLKDYQFSAMNYQYRSLEVTSLVSIFVHKKLKEEKLINFINKIQENNTNKHKCLTPDNMPIILDIILEHNAITDKIFIFNFISKNINLFESNNNENHYNLSKSYYSFIGDYFEYKRKRVEGISKIKDSLKALVGKIGALQSKYGEAAGAAIDQIIKIERQIDSQLTPNPENFTSDDILAYIQNNRDKIDAPRTKWREQTRKLTPLIEFGIKLKKGDNTTDTTKLLDNLVDVIKSLPKAEDYGLASYELTNNSNDNNRIGYRAN
jgi:hypothetical protein